MRDAAIRALWTVGRQAWPDLALPEDAFFEQLAARLDPDIDPSKLVAADLYLVCACLDGVPGATERFLSGPLATAARHAARRGDGDDTAELIQELAVQLLLPGPSGSPAKLAQYSGRGALAVWLRMTVTRRAINATRGRDRTVPIDDGGFEPVGTHDPEVSAVRRVHRPDMAPAVALALAAIPAEDRTLLRLHYVQGSTLTELAALYRTSRSAMHRRLDTARGDLLRGVQGALRSRMKLSETECGSLLVMFQSDLRDLVGELLRG